MASSESDPTNGGVGNHDSEVTLEEMRARLDALRNDPVFGDATGEATNDRTDLMKLMMMEFLQGNRPKPKSEQEECSNMFKRFSAHKPPTYDGKPDPTEFEEWLNSMEKLFDATQCPDKWKVNFAVFYLKGQADLWWKTIKDMQKESDFGWEKLKEALRNQFYPQSLRLQMEDEFIHLKQRNMTVLEYAVKFNELARFAPDLVSTDRQRMSRFEGGLNLDLQEKLSTYISSSYQELYDRAINVERKTKLRKEIYDQGKRKVTSQEGQQNKSFNKRQFTGSYQGGNRNREQNQAPWCSKCGKQGHLMKDCRKGTNQCYRCGKSDHLVKDCPTAPERRAQGGNNLVPAREQRNFQTSSYGNNVNNNRNNPRGPPQAGRVFMMQKDEAEADDTVITGTFPVHSTSAYVLFDSGASHSFISLSFSKCLNIEPCLEFHAMSITLPNGRSVSCDKMFRNCPILIGRCEFFVNLIQFDLTDFDVILGMDWLSKYQADINCLKHEITLTGPNNHIVTYQRQSTKPKTKIISH